MDTLNRRQLLRGAELAWLLEDLCWIGIGMRARGWCLGELRAGELRLGPGGLERSAVSLRSAVRRRTQHLRRGHDTGCIALGAPRKTVSLLLRSWGDPEAALLLDDAVDEALEELSSSVWSADAARELVSYTIRSRITPQQPAVSVVLE